MTVGIMKITLAIVTSVNGKSTKGNLSPKDWASKEDQSYFSSLITHHNLIVMGKNTYKIIKPNLKHSPQKLRVVMTRSLQQFSKFAIPNQLEFTDLQPKQLIKNLEDRGFKQLLLVSGAKLNTAFFKENLINELYLTLEPKIFGSGFGIVDKLPLHINLKLISIKKLNSQGTLLLQYSVLSS